MKTVIFNARGLLPIVMVWKMNEQNMGARPTAGNGMCEITPDGMRRARAGMKAKMEMRRSWRWGSGCRGVSLVGEPWLLGRELLYKDPDRC